MRAIGEYFTSNVSLTSPLGALAANNGGEEVCFAKPSRGVAVVAGVLLIGLGAIAGRAMTPPGRSRGAYTVGGAVASIFGPLGIGLLGVVSLSQRKN